jgi:hypoxanthine phosphoribosyltransferase
VTDQPRFAHASEAELARILDYYGVSWEYEPRTFPILWNTDGKVVESFSPDFYLPELDTYVELTTLKQSLVRRKNRKLRRLRELYPDIRIKLFYGKDFRALMLKYGRFDLAASLSGLEGQLSPDRPEVEPSLRLTIPAPVEAEVQIGQEDVPIPIATQQPEPADHAEPADQPESSGQPDSAKRLYRPRPSRGTRRRRGRRAFIGAEES